MSFSHGVDEHSVRRTLWADNSGSGTPQPEQAPAMDLDLHNDNFAVPAATILPSHPSLMDVDDDSSEASQGTAAARALERLKM